MLNRVITISREFGSGGRTIGKKWLKTGHFLLRCRATWLSGRRHGPVIALR